MLETIKFFGRLLKARVFGDSSNALKDPELIQRTSFSKEQWDGMAESLPGMVYQCRLWPGGRCAVTYTNRAIEWIYEKKWEDVREDCRCILDLVHPDDIKKIKTTLWESVINVTPWRGEYRVILPRQGVRWRFAKANVERLPDGSTLWNGFIADVTWRKEIESHLLVAKGHEMASLRHAKQAAEDAEHRKSEFLTFMSHELRTPLNGILGFSDILKTTTLTNEQREYVDTIEQCGQRLLAMVTNTLDLARIEARRFVFDREAFDLRKCIEEAWGLLQFRAKEKGLEYTLCMDDALPRFLVGDQLRIIQALTNLLGNAIKYTERGGITLNVWTLEKYEPDSVPVFFAIQDTGVGISNEEIKSIFDPYYQVHNKRTDSTGLGLTVTRELCRLMGGDLTVTSELGTGSTFTMELKFQIAEEKDVPTASEAGYRDDLEVAKIATPGK